MRLVKIADEIGIFFDKWDWENASAYEAMDEMRTLIPRNRLKFDRDLLCWFTDNRMLDVVERLVKKYDQTGLEKIQWEWDQKELKSKKKNDLYVWLYKQDHKKVKSVFTKKQKKNLMAQWNDPHRVANIIRKRVEIII